MRLAASFATGLNSFDRSCAQQAILPPGQGTRVRARAIANGKMRPGATIMSVQQIVADREGRGKVFELTRWHRLHGKHFVQEESPAAIATHVAALTGTAKA